MKASAEEIEYLCNSVSEYLAKPVKPADVVWTYAGVRPLYDDGASEAKAATRDYVFELDTPGGAPLLSIYGGKITTYRRLAEEALERLSPYLRSAKAREGWTAKSPLPGGDLDVSAIAALTAELLRNIRSLSRRMRAASHTPTAPAPTRFWARRNPLPISANRSARR